MADETSTGRALREAIATARRDRAEPDPVKRTGGDLVNYERVVAAARADERAKLAAAVPPMTMTAEQEAAVRGDVHYVARSELYNFVDFAVAEVDALRAALAAEREAHAETRAERDERQELHTQLAEMMAAHDYAGED